MFELTYTLQNHGWAAVEFGNEEASYTVTASYLSDPLGDIARAARSLLRGLPTATFDLIQEPGQHRFTLSLQGEDV